MNKTHKPVGSLEEARAKLQKQYGESVILQQDSVPEKIDVVPTGCFALDDLLGCGGLPRGRIIEIYGEMSSGKSTLCLYLASQVQKNGGTVAYLDNENAYDRQYAELLGVDTSQLLLSQPTTLEETFDIIRAYTEANCVDLIVVDSVAAMVPKTELEGEEMLKDSVALQARLLGKGLRILTGPVGRSSTIVIFINQTRSNVGIMYGPKDTTPGGKALKFFSSVRLNVKKGERIEGNGKEQIGNTIKITATKNKVGFPYRSGSFDLYYGEGVDLVSDTLEYGVSTGVVELSGNTYSYGEKKLGVGREKAKTALREDEKLFNEVRKKVYKALK